MGYLCLWIFMTFVQVAGAYYEPEKKADSTYELWGVSDEDEASTFETIDPVKRKNFYKNDQLTWLVGIDFLTFCCYVVQVIWMVAQRKKFLAFIGFTEGMWF